MNVWTFTGFTFEELISKQNNDINELLHNIDVLVDGKFVEELKDLSLFKSARVSFDTVEWENEADIDPETLYEDSVPYNIS